MPALRWAILVMLLAAPAWAARAPPAPSKPQPPPKPQPAPQTDAEPPVIEPLAVPSARPGEPLTIRARIEDASALFSPAVFVRYPGRSPASLALSRLPDGTFGATLMPESDFDFWIEAYDEYGNGPARAGSPEAPLTVRLVRPPPKPPAAPPVPPPPAPAPSFQVVEARQPAAPREAAPDPLEMLPDEPEGRVPVDAIVGSAGFAGLVVAMIAGGLTVSAARDWKAASDTGSRAAWVEARDQVRTRALVANVAWGVGGVLTAAGLGLYLSGAF